MKRIGVYKIETSFNITGRGIIAVCQQIEGIRKIGSQTTLEIDRVKTIAKIVGYDMGKLGEDGIFRCGLLLSFLDDSLTKKVATEKLKEQIIEIFYPSELPLV